MLDILPRERKESQEWNIKLKDIEINNANVPLYMD